MTHDDCIRAARSLAPLLREKAREGEIARRPLDDVIEAARSTGLFSMMVPKRYGGHEKSFLDRYVVTEEMLSVGAPCRSHWAATAMAPAAAPPTTCMHARHAFNVE